MTEEPLDEELVARAARGELDAFESLVRRYQALAVRVAFLITDDLADAEDVVQDAFVKAHQSLGRVQVDSFRAWLLRIVSNEARNQRKSNRRQASTMARAAGGNLVGGSTASPEVAVLAEEQRIVLLTALDGLRDEDRLAISYRYFFDFSETEMVEALGWRRGTVKSRLARALVRMRAQLGELALLPPTVFALPQIARELASWNQGQLEHGLSGLAAHFAALPVRDVSAALIAKLQLGLAGAQPRSVWSHAQVWLGAAAATVIAVSVGVLAFTGMQHGAPTAASAPASPAPGAPPPASPTSIVIFGSDLTDAEHAEVATTLQASSGSSSQTLDRADVLSTLAAANLPSSPESETLSSVRLTCPATDHSISVQTHQVRQLPALTYATALLVAGSNDASVLVAAPTDSSVTGESALVGLLTASGRCGAPPSRVSLGYVVLRTTSRIAGADGDWTRASAMVSDAVHAIVTGQAHSPDSIAQMLDSTSQANGVLLDADVRRQLADELVSLVGQEYGAYAHGYRVEAPSLAAARLVP